jgi:hypothetical protein
VLTITIPGLRSKLRRSAVVVQFDFHRPLNASADGVNLGHGKTRIGFQANTRRSDLLRMPRVPLGRFNSPRHGRGSMAHGAKGVRASLLRGLSDLRGVQSSPRAERLNSMLRRKLRIVRDHPLLGICEYCNEQFTSGLMPVAAAKDDIQERFDAHKCEPEDVNQAAARIVRETTEKD